MVAISDEEMETLLTSFDQIYEKVKEGIVEIQFLKSSCNAEVERREALETTCNSLKIDNERLRKLYTESLNKMADQLERRSKCQSLKEELKKLTEEHHSKENEHMKAMEMLRQENAAKITDLEKQYRYATLQQVSQEATVNQLQHELAAHRSHIEILNNRLVKVHAEVELKYLNEIQDLKDWLLIEQDEKSELSKKLEIVEKELTIMRTKMAEQQRDFTSNHHVETLKQKIMKLRKENEILKRKLCGFDDT